MKSLRDLRSRHSLPHVWVKFSISCKVCSSWVNCSVRRKFIFLVPCDLRATQTALLRNPHSDFSPENIS